MSFASVLLISNDFSLEETVAKTIEDLGRLQLEHLPDVRAAVSTLEKSDVCLIIVHVTSTSQPTQLLQFLRKSRSGRKRVPVLFIGDREEPELMLILFRSGIVDYLVRPLCSKKLQSLIAKVTRRHRLHAKDEVTDVLSAGASAYLSKATTADEFAFQPQEPMGPLMEQVRKIARLDATVLLQGETGTGKTRIARLIHDLSPRRNHPFLVVNCGCLSGSLIESELFGHAKGAFTSALENRSGKFAEVGHGTLLLDDIDTLPFDLQSKLLRVVEERVFEQVGSNVAQSMHGRLLVASNRDLRDLAARGHFRSDLFYRLDVIGFYLPPLRERRRIIPTLASRFVKEFAVSNNTKVHGISQDAITLLVQHDWPGNIRELQNVLQRAVTFCQGPNVEPRDFMDVLHGMSLSKSKFVTPAPAAERHVASLATRRDRSEAACIEDALVRCNNNQLRVAAELGISRMTLYKKLHKYGLMRGDCPQGDSCSVR